MFWQVGKCRSLGPPRAGRTRPAPPPGMGSDMFSGCHFGSSLGLSLAILFSLPFSRPWQPSLPSSALTSFRSFSGPCLASTMLRALVSCVAWHRYNPRVADDSPTVTGSDGRGGLVQEPYSRFRQRAFARERIARLDARIGAPPPDERGRYVFVGWSIITGRRWPTAVPLNEVPDGVWWSKFREAPFATAVADPRYWRGDQFWFWHTSRFPDARAWPRVEQPPWVRTRVPLWYRLWTHGPLPAPRLSGQRGLPAFPPDPRQ